jgi:hypothetical protein
MFTWLIGAAAGFGAVYAVNVSLQQTWLKYEEAKQHFPLLADEKIVPLAVISQNKLSESASQRTIDDVPSKVIEITLDCYRLKPSQEFSRRDSPAPVTAQSEAAETESLAPIGRSVTAVAPVAVVPPDEVSSPTLPVVSVASEASTQLSSVTAATSPTAVSIESPVTAPVSAATQNALAVAETEFVTLDHNAAAAAAAAISNVTSKLNIDSTSIAAHTLPPTVADTPGATSAAIPSALPSTPPIATSHTSSVADEAARSAAVASVVARMSVLEQRAAETRALLSLQQAALAVAGALVEPRAVHAELHALRIAADTLALPLVVAAADRATRVEASRAVLSTTALRSLLSVVEVRAKQLEAQHVARNAPGASVMPAFVVNAYAAVVNSATAWPRETRVWREFVLCVDACTRRGAA